MLQVASPGKRPYKVLKQTIFRHPTLAKGLDNVFLPRDAQCLD